MINIKKVIELMAEDEFDVSYHDGDEHDFIVPDGIGTENTEIMISELSPEKAYALGYVVKGDEGELFK